MFRSLTRSQITVDAVIAAVFAAIALSVELAVGETVGTISVFGAPIVVFASAAIALVFGAAVAVRRWSPPIALALAWAGAILQMSLGRPPSFADLAIFGVLYVTAAYGTQRVFWAGFASALLGAFVITLYLFLGSTFARDLTLQSLPVAVAVLIAAAFALLLSWTVGALVRTASRARENRDAQERAEADAVVEQERLRIARDMHDVVAHSLAVVVAQADGARYAAASDPAVAADALNTISVTARAALADVRLLLTQLRHDESDGPQPTLADLEELYAQVRAAGVELRIDVDPVPPGVPPAAVQLAAYRILQEALTNVIRHGDGGPAHVGLAWYQDRLDLRVSNRVRSGARLGESGHGIVGMRERAGLVGGRLDASDRDGEFVVSATLPIGARVGG